MSMIMRMCMSMSKGMSMSMSNKPHNFSAGIQDVTRSIYVDQDF